MTEVGWGLGGEGTRFGWQVGWRNAWSFDWVVVEVRDEVFLVDEVGGVLVELRQV